MTNKQFDAAFSAFCRRRPFRTFLIEFMNGNQLLIAHPEAVRREPEFYVARRPDRGFVVFAADGVTRLLDIPIPAAN